IIPYTLLLFTCPASTPIYPLSLHDALPISHRQSQSHSLRFGAAERFEQALQNRLGHAWSVIAHRDLAIAMGSATARHGHFPRRRSEEHTSELQSRENLVCRLLLEKKKKKKS